jgi:hypothetical protein
MDFMYGIFSQIFLYCPISFGNIISEFHYKADEKIYTCFLCSYTIITILILISNLIHISDFEFNLKINVDFIFYLF